VQTHAQQYALLMNYSRNTMAMMQFINFCLSKTSLDSIHSITKSHLKRTELKLKVNFKTLRTTKYY